ncbi:hypothetical protein [Blastococcus atacamensis]|uniref:hypothetical protein n=1 Tax=Blastococcus atacamensis TaxID=2070508 RepID=UPI0012FFF36E|nr:hypothetical protein [Blastococcus atacamensis]
MSALWLVAAAWMAVALLLAMVIGRAVRIADDADVLGERNFVVDGDPLQAPVPEAFAAAGSYVPPARGIA